jgi:hypothetical protein
VWERSTHLINILSQALNSSPYIYLQFALHLENIGLTHQEILETFKQGMVKTSISPPFYTRISNIALLAPSFSDKFVSQSLDALKNYPDYGFVINLDTRPERWVAFEQQLQAISKTKFFRFPAIAVPSNGAIGCAASHCRIMENHLLAKNHSNNLLILEDDALFTPEFHLRWPKIKAVLDNREDWDVFLGGVTDGMRPPTPRITKILDPEEKLVCIDKGLTAHFVYINHKSIQDVLHSYNYTLPIDDHYNKFRLVTSLPFLAVQRPSVSNITEAAANYLTAFNQAEVALLEQLSGLIPKNPPNKEQPSPCEASELPEQLSEIQSLPAATPSLGLSLGILLFSENKPLLLQRQLSSINTHLSPLGAITVLYRSDLAFEEEYNQLKHQFSNVTFAQEPPLSPEERQRCFLHLVFENLRKMPCSHAAFGHEETILTENIDLVECLESMQAHQGYSLLLDLATEKLPKESIPISKESKNEGSSGLVKWQYSDQSPSPHSLNMSICTKGNLIGLIKSATDRLSSLPQTLEGLEKLCHSLQPHHLNFQGKAPTIIAYTSPRCMRIPSNTPSFNGSMDGSSH